MITGTMNVPMTLEKANYYNALERRDMAKAVVEHTYKDNEGNEHSYYKCPVCDEFVYDGEAFCKSCGQRIDMENIEL